MPLLYRFAARASFDQTAEARPALAVVATVEGSAPGPELEASADLVAGMVAQLRPRLGAVQAVALRARTIVPPANVVLDERHLAGSVSVDRSLFQKSGFGMSVPASRDGWIRGPLRYEVDFDAPPPGAAPVSFEMAYRLADGSEVVFPLLTGGRSVASDRGVDRSSHVLDLQGLGPESIYDRARITYQLEPNHGKRHGEIIRGILSACGVPDDLNKVSAALGSPRQKALDITNEEGYRSAQEAADAVGCVIVANRAGEFVAVNVDPSETGRAAWTFDVGQLSAGSKLKLTETSEKPSCVTFTGDAPGFPDGLPDGVESTTTVVETWEVFGVRGASWRQESDGSLDPLDGDLEAKLTIKNRVTTTRRKRSGCLIEEEVVTEEWFSPQAARYTVAADGTQSARLNVYVYEPAAVDFDAAPAYLWKWFRFVEVSRVVTRYDYSGAPVVVPGLGVVSLGGALTRKTVTVNGWHNPRHALKERANTFTPWDETDFIDGVKTTGAGEGVDLESEFYFGGRFIAGFFDSNPYQGMEVGTLRVGAALRIDTTTYVSEGGYELSNATELLGWDSPKGSLYLYNGDDARAFEAFRGGNVGRREVTNSTDKGSNAHRVTERTYDVEGKLSQKFEDREGNLPAIPKCSPTDNARNSNRPFKVGPICFGAPSRFEQDLSNPFVESESEAEIYLRRFLARLGPTLEFEMPANGALSEGMLVRCYFPEIGVDRMGKIESLSHGRQGRGAPLLTSGVVRLRRAG